MIAKVENVISELIIEIDTLWHFNDFKGSRIKIAGLIPSKKESRNENKKLLEELLLNKSIEIIDFLFVSGRTLLAEVKVNNNPVQDSFPERKIPIPQPSRWVDSDESWTINYVFGGIPTTWKNPIRFLDIKSDPYFGNLKYPIKFWDRDYEKELKIVKSLFVDSHHNKKELDEWFEIFINYPHREAPMLLIGDVGIGKSWWICNKVMNLDSRKFHKIIIDLRYLRRGEYLEYAIIDELLEFLNYYVTGVSWMLPDYIGLFSQYEEIPEKYKDKIIDKISTLSKYDLLKKKLRYYNESNAPELIVVFDNLDHFRFEEHLTLIDLCTRIIGNASGVRVVVVIRPSTLINTSRTGKIYGESFPRQIKLQSPNVYDVLFKRIVTNCDGEYLNPYQFISGTNITWHKLYQQFRKSDTTFGLARLLKELCSTENLSYNKDLSISTSKYGKELDVTYDIRHYLKLFRRILLSDCLNDLKNIANAYYGIHAMLISGDEHMHNNDAYLFNLFDNDQKELRGNALIRYRVLEYCDVFHDLGDVFDMYFTALGCGKNNARAVLDLFAEAGLVKVINSTSKEGNMVPYRAFLTTPGRRHFEIITNMWYIICIKTGMNIFEEYILKGNEARNEASQFIKSSMLLDYYADHGWVSEDSFIEYIGRQEILESRRIGAFQESHPEMASQIANMVEKISSPAAIIYYSYKEQITYWKNYHQRN